MNRNRCIDTLKGVASILVIFIHYPFPGTLGVFVKAIARGAVPFFFIVSGYYYGLVDSEQTVLKGKKMIYKLIRLLLIGWAFSEVFLIQQYSVHNAIENQLSVTSILKLLIFNETCEIYHLWYLCALIYCYIVFIFFRRFFNKCEYVKLGLLFSLLILGRFTLEMVYRRTSAISIYIFRNWLFTGIPFFGFGFIYHFIKKYIIKYNCLAVIFTLVGLFSSILESFFFGNMEIYIGTLFLSLGAFSFAVEHPDLEICRFITILGNKYSSWIYILHWGIMHMEYKLIGKFCLDTLFFGGYMFISPIMLTIYTIICAVIFEKLFILVNKKKRLCIRSEKTTIF